MKNTTFVAGATTLFVLVGLGCGDLGWIDTRYQPLVNRNDTGESRLARITSPEEWVDFFGDQVSARTSQGSLGSCSGGNANTNSSFNTGLVSMSPDSAGTAGPSPQASPPSSSDDKSAESEATDGSSGESGSGSFTSTNIQEIGVDESDVVKSDGEYFYMVVGTQLRIVRAYPVEDMEELSSLELEGGNYYSGADLYLNGDRAIAITQETVYLENEAGSRETSMTASPDGCYGCYGTPPQNIVVVTLVDVTDRSHPAIEATWKFQGRKVNSRMIDGMLHLVASQNPYIPHDFEVSDLTVEDIQQYIPTFVVTFADGSEESGAMISTDNFYYPVDPDGYTITAIVSLDTNEIPEEFSSVAIMADTGTIYSSTEALYLTDPDQDWYCGYREAVDIHKFVYTENGVEYVASGSATGRLLNQFSLGEHNGYLRVGTTTGHSTRVGPSDSQNYIFVLGEEGDRLEVIGSIENIAPGEKIYSARFVGDKGFLVTFRKVDPLYTIDFSEPADPKLVGELKITGYSDYIHILDEDHLLTFGKAASEDGYYQGAQLSIFDVSNFADPQLLIAKEIGVRGTGSEALYNHKAFTFYRDENLLAIPVDLYEAEGSQYQGMGDNWQQGQWVFSGLQIYHVSPEEGINLKGQISTSESNQYGLQNYYGWTRGMFIEEYVYAITEIGIKAAPANDPGSVTDSIEIEGSPNVYQLYEDDMWGGQPSTVVGL